MSDKQNKLYKVTNNKNFNKTSNISNQTSKNTLEVKHKKNQTTLLEDTVQNLNNTKNIEKKYEKYDVTNTSTNKSKGAHIIKKVHSNISLNFREQDKQSFKTLKTNTKIVATMYKNKNKFSNETKNRQTNTFQGSLHNNQSSLISKIKFNIKYKLINFLYISKAFFPVISVKKNQIKINFFYLHTQYKKILFNLKYFLILKHLFFLQNNKIKNNFQNKISINLTNKETYNFMFENLFTTISNLNISQILNFTELNLFLNNKQNLSILNPNTYLSYDLNYYDFISQNDINQNIKEQQFLIKKKKKLAKGTGFLFLPEKFLNKLSPQKKKLLTSYILQQQKRKKHEVYGYLSTIETKPLITKGFIRPRKKMKKLGILYYRPTRRNLKMTFVDSSGQVLAYYSCGTNKKFKKARRRLKDVRERTLFKMTVQIDDLKYKRIIVAFKGSQFVKVFKVLKRRRLKIIGYSFDTLIPHNGCRKPKKKRK